MANHVLKSHRHLVRISPEASDERTSRMVTSVLTAEMQDRDQDAETVLAALRMTSRTTSGFDSMGT